MTTKITPTAPTRPKSVTRATSPLLGLVGILLVAGNLRTAITTVGPVLPDIQQSIGISSLLASLLVSLPLLAFAITSPLAPRLAHHIGLERTIGVSLLMLAAGLVLRSAPSIAMLWIGTASIGVSIAILNVVLPALIKRDLPTRIGQVTGGYSAVQSTFAAIAAGIAAPLAGLTALGWRLPLGMWAGLALIALAFFAPQLRRRTILTSSEEDIVFGDSELRSTGWRSPWRSLLGWQVTAFMGLQSVVFYTVITWTPSIEADAGISAADISVHQFLLNALGILASLMCSALIPRMRDQRLLAMAGPLLLIVGLLGLLLFPHVALLWMSIIGFAGGVNIVLALSFFGLRTTHHAQAASLSGMAQSIGYLIAAAGPIAFGALHDAVISWVPTLIGLVIISVILVALGYLSGRNRTIEDTER
ncbi:CynX/NimT family MFS transporter [Okibacterium endophyticum]